MRQIPQIIISKPKIYIFLFQVPFKRPQTHQPLIAIKSNQSQNNFIIQNKSQMGCGNAKPGPPSKKQPQKNTNYRQIPENFNPLPQYIDPKNYQKPAQSVEPAKPVHIVEKEKPEKDKPITYDPAPVIHSQVTNKQPFQLEKKYQKSQMQNPLLEPQKQLKNSQTGVKNQLISQSINKKEEINQNNETLKNKELYSIIQTKSEHESSNMLNKHQFPNINQQKPQNKNVSNKQQQNNPLLESLRMISNISNSNHKENKQSNFKFLKDQNKKEINSRLSQINRDDIKLNVASYSNNSENFMPLDEEQFDMRCSFNPNVLIVDINKVDW